MPETKSQVGDNRLSNPSRIVSRQVRRLAAMWPISSPIACGQRSRWSEAMKPSILMRLTRKIRMSGSAVGLPS